MPKQKMPIKWSEVNRRRYPATYHLSWWQRLVVGGHATNNRGYTFYWAYANRPWWKPGGRCYGELRFRHIKVSNRNVLRGGGPLNTPPWANCVIGYSRH